MEIGRHMPTKPRSLLKGHLQVPGVNPVTGQIITPINVVYKFLKDFLFWEGGEIQSLANKYVNDTRDFDESDTPTGGL